MAKDFTIPPRNNFGDKREDESSKGKQAKLGVRAPMTGTIAKALENCCIDEVNSAALRDADRQDMPEYEGEYNMEVDQGLASRRSKHILRTHEEVRDSIDGDLPAAEGLSFRAPMAGQCENDQFCFSTDAYGKQRK